VLLRRAGGLGLDWQLFLMRLKRLSTAALSDFYSALLRYLAAAKAHKRRGCGAWVLGVGRAYLSLTDGSGCTKVPEEKTQKTWHNKQD
jgi:hypothetical protein